MFQPGAQELILLLPEQHGTVFFSGIVAQGGGIRNLAFEKVEDVEIFTHCQGFFGKGRFGPQPQGLLGQGGGQGRIGRGGILAQRPGLDNR